MQLDERDRVGGIIPAWTDGCGDKVGAGGVDLEGRKKRFQDRRRKGVTKECAVRVSANTHTKTEFSTSR